MHQKPLNFSKLMHVIVFICFFIALIFLYAIVMAPITAIFHIDADTFSESSAIPLLAISIIVYYLLYRFFSKKMYNSKIATNADKINQLVAVIEETTSQLNKSSIVPPNYRNLTALNR